jgi:hypothetical protein
MPRGLPRGVSLLLSLILFEAFVLSYALNRPYWGDEEHFVETVNLFGQGVSIDTLKHYNEMSTPLPFILYSLWGRLLDFDVQALRIFSVIIALTTYVLFHRLMFCIFDDGRISFLTTAFIAFHPYMGLSAFVFTDMLAVLFIVLSCISIRKESPIILSISLACGLLCRQYFVFFVLSVIVHYFLKYLIGGKRNRPLVLLSSSLISIVPLAVLVFIWKGLSPDNHVREIYLDDGYRFHAAFLTLYICQLFVYLSPIILIGWKAFYGNRRIMFSCFVVSWIYWLFPVRPCKYQVAGGIHTVGFFHKFVKFIFKSQLLEDVVFHVTFLLGLPITVSLAQHLWHKWQVKELDFAFLLDLAIMSFFLVMPFSYLCWEKYFVLILPLASVRILLTIQGNR